MTKPTLQLAEFQFEELFHSEGLQRLDQKFLAYLQKTNAAIYAELLAYRNKATVFTPQAISELLIASAIVLESFLTELFQIEEAAAIAKAQTLSHNPVSAFKQFFVLRKAKKQLLHIENLVDFSILHDWLNNQLKISPLQTEDLELAISLLASQYIAQPEQFLNEIDKLTQWCIHGLITPTAQKIVQGWTSFRIPERLDYSHLVAHVPVTHDKLERSAAPASKLRQRDGFKLTDPRMTARQAQDEVNYCIYCHDHDGDFCSKGFPVKKGDPTQGLKKNPLETIMTGCPLEEKISEMHFLKRDGYTLAALAMVMVDNPLCPATGHRICNDCMKACIYQKQEPVNIPQAETRILTDVLHLPWGVEIYDLLTRWNPLRQSQWIMKSYNGLKIMIAGMGPAGFTLAHHLLLEGFAVVGFDGLKIEPLDPAIIKNPVYQWSDLYEALDERLMAGFGGVAEYGITVRWDKNFLKLIYLSLLRKPYFQVFGSTRFGGTITVDDAWRMGFDHFVIAVGAGLPKALSIPGSLAPGMRQANDFLMALQLGNAAKKTSLTNLQVRLPAVIIGGGLTGVDTATEVQAYYITQVEKILFRYETLVTFYNEEDILQKLDIPSLEILEEFITHGKAIRHERARAEAANEQPNFIKLIHQWGGVTIVYRRFMQDSPAYIHNHEELTKALEEGVFYLEALEPAFVDLNQHGHVETLICHKRLRKDKETWEATQTEIRIPARAIFVATGTQPNIAYEFEHRGTFTRLGLQYQHYEDLDGNLTVAHGVEHVKEADFGPFTSYQKSDHRVSLVGDTHPVFHGSVVKAIASGMRTYPKIVALLESKLHHDKNKQDYATFSKNITELFNAKITHIERCTKNVIELTIQAPLAALNFQPGQFYRLQNYATHAPLVENTSLQIEPLALMAFDVNQQTGFLKLMIIETGASSKLCATFRVGDPVSLMGPTGTRAKISHQHETVLIIGNQLSLAMLRSYGTALRHAGNTVIYLGNFKTKEEVYCQEALENATDIIIWSTQNGDLIPTARPQDFSTQGDALDILIHCAQTKKIPLTDVDRIYVMGDPELLQRFQLARQTSLKEFLMIKNPRILGSVYSTMQCMLKGVCAQCLQWQIDPQTGQRTKAVFACSWPEQPLELIDIDNIHERQVQNRLQEQLSSLWVDYLFDHSLAKQALHCV
jgi:NADPH-dependent glutamate synthase beta subunit-like oxidoreductase/NAD(P)H-flavin reductase